MGSGHSQPVGVLSRYTPRLVIKPADFAAHADPLTAAPEPAPDRVMRFDRTSALAARDERRNDVMEPTPTAGARQRFHELPIALGG